MSPVTPLILAGHVYQSDGSTIQEGAKVWVYNKTRDETHNANESGLDSLTTNANGEWMVNLANFTTQWVAGDVIWVSAYYEDTAQSITFTLTGSPEQDKDLTLRNWEPSIALSKLLMAKLTDPNSSNRATTEKWIRPSYSRRELVKNNYPIITIKDIDEDNESVGIDSNKAEENTTTLLITVYVWSKSSDSQRFTIGGVSYEGSKYRDYLARRISNVLRKEFYQRPIYNKDAIVHKFYSYERVRMESLDFDEEEDFNIMKKEIEIQIQTINQEV